MVRKISAFVSLLVLAIAVFTVAAAGTPNPDAAVNGCYVDAPTLVNEGVSIPVTIKCDGIPTDNNVFGFQMGTSVTGDFSGSAPAAYTAGDFTTAAVGGVAGVLVGDNSLALYGVSRKTTDVISSTDFTLGSYTMTADTNQTAVDGSVGITFIDGTFKLSDNLGESLTGWQRTINDDTVTVNDIDLAWLNGNTTVRSDSNVIGNIQNVVLNLGAKQYSAATVASYQTVLSMDDTYLYVEDASGVVGGSYAAAQDSNDTLNIAVSADMWGHLDCSVPAVNLLDAGAAEDVDGFVGTAGVVTLKAGDTDDDGTISNTDATIIGDDFGDTESAINALYEGDMNLDASVDILDLVHVGRNFNAATAVCG